MQMRSSRDTSLFRSAEVRAPPGGGSHRYCLQEPHSMYPYRAPPADIYGFSHSSIARRNEVDAGLHAMPSGLDSGAGHPGDDALPDDYPISGLTHSSQMGLLLTLAMVAGGSSRQAHGHDERNVRLLMPFVLLWRLEEAYICRHQT